MDIYTLLPQRAAVKRGGQRHQIRDHVPSPSHGHFENVTAKTERESAYRVHKGRLSAVYVFARCP